MADKELRNANPSLPLINSLGRILCVENSTALLHVVENFTAHL